MFLELIMSIFCVKTIFLSFFPQYMEKGLTTNKTNYIIDYSEWSRSGGSMKSLFGVSATEREVMEKLWDQQGSVKQSQLLALFEADGKEWKRQTLNTFLSRLEDKGLVERKNRMVTPVYSREEYNYMQMKAAVDHMYGGRLSNFVAAFARKDAINESEAEELIKILKNK